MKTARAASLVTAGALLLAPGCSGRPLKLGVDDAIARSALRATTITFAKDRGLYLARGDGSGEKRLLAGEKLGAGGTVFLPAIAPGGSRLLFLGATDLEVRDSTARALSLNILTLESTRFTAWRQIMLEKIAPPGPDGRQEIFAVAAAAWSREGDRVALGLSRDTDHGGDAVAVFDARGGPVAVYSLGERELARVSSICWFAGGRSLILGMAGDDDVEGRVARLDLPDPGGSATLVDLGVGQYPALEPGDGRLAVLDHSGGQWDMVLLSTDGEELQRYPGLAGRAPHLPYWSTTGRYLYYYSLASIGPLGLIEIRILRCLDTRSREIFDLVRLG